MDISNEPSEVNSSKEEQQVVEKNNPRDDSVENPDSSCEVTRKESSNISSAVVEEEDAVLGEDGSAKEFDVNIDEDELLKDTDTDDFKNANSKSAHSKIDVAHLENTEENRLGTEQIEHNESTPQSLSSEKEEDPVTENTVPVLNKDVGLCNIEDKSVLSTNHLFTEDGNSNKDSLQCAIDKPNDVSKIPENNITEEVSCSNRTETTNVEEQEEVNVDVTDSTDNKVDSENDNIYDNTSLCSNNVDEKLAEVTNNSLNEVSNNNPDDLNVVKTTDTNNILIHDKNVKNSEQPGGESKTINSGETKLLHVDQDTMIHDKNIKISEQSGGESKTINSDETKFLHVDQDTSRPDESYEAIDTGGEDPFAQTCDEIMDTSESSEKGAETENVETVQGTTMMDLDEVSLNSNAQTISELNTLEQSEVVSEHSTKATSQNELTVESSENYNSCKTSSPSSQIKEIDLEMNGNSNLCDKSSPTLQAEETDVLKTVSDHNLHNRSSPSPQTKEPNIVDNPNTCVRSSPTPQTEKPGVESNDNSILSDRNSPKSQIEETNDSNDNSNSCHRSSPTSQTEETDIVKSNNSYNLCDKSSSETQTGGTNESKESNQTSKNENKLYMCLVSDKDKKPNEVSTEEQPGNVVLNKQKTVKSKHRGRKSSSDDDSDDSEIDFEIKSKSVQRPKRNAAKKAESQIKVVREFEEAEEQEDHDTNVVEDTRDSVEEPEEMQTCYVCKKVNNCKINILSYGQTNYFCDDTCFTVFRDGPLLKPGESTEIVPSSTVIKEIRSANIQPIERAAFIRKCSQCSSVVKSDNEKTLSWETMDFCSEECLGKYQQELGSHCANCKGNVQPVSLGKYCVRFGYEVKQFCCSTCLEEFKKGLKVCSFCQKDISSGAEGFLAPVGDKGTFKDFCTQGCMEKYEQMSSNQPPPPQVHPCHVCNNVKLVEVEVLFESKLFKLCSDICFTAYKFANELTVDRCDMCKTYFDKDANGEKFNIFYDEIPHNFCCKTCMNVYILAKRKIVPCNWCKVKKYNFDMIKRVLISGQVLMMCSLNCMTLYQVSINAVSSRRIKCDMCMSVAQAQYHLTMSDATIRNFCTYPCVMNFQQQYSKSPITLPGSDAPPIPTGGPVPVISSVTSLTNGQPTNIGAKKSSGKLNLVTRLLEPAICRNKNTQTRPIMNTKSVSCRPHTVSVHTQTEESKGPPIIIPVPVPIYVPCPMAMYSFPFPVPVPFPLAVPVPVFLPTTRNSIKGIMKEIKCIQEKVPTDPFEAELLMMAEMVAADKKEEVTSSESEPDHEPAAASAPNSDEEGDFNSESMETSNAFGEDIMQIALKMATELDEPAVDLESQLTPSTIVNQPQSENNDEKSNNVESPKRKSTGETRGRKRSITKSPQKINRSSDTKKKKSNHNSDVSTTCSSPVVVEEIKPDANMKLKYTFGVNAWKSWVSQKNAEIERLSSTNKKLKPLKTDILQLTVDELNFSLCMFVKEVQKPNGTQYAPDTIYYLCLGIQQYLYENGRIDNIFTDSYFESFTDSLDEIAKKFTELFNDHHYIVTRVEEEHLWESKQLGAHSPHVLLSTLMFFNTKHFNLTNVDEHMLLSFSHIMKHWKRNTNQSTITTGGGKAPGSRNVLLRFYPPQAVVDDPNSKKKKVYEQQANEENPLRCPVKLYEFYMSKCTESVKSRSDVFYLQPERSCVPDSPVWYSTMALGREPLDKMLNRVKMVKEINIALLTP